MPDDALAKLLQSCETNNDTEIQDAALNIINQGYAADIVVYQVGGDSVHYHGSNAI